ncbi:MULTISPECIES: hypothetical protein [unclassified Mesorhizobium]|uniref:hypothetical protein n=1 Tax=unclassified Mesorhizobium TaxID=325217 RepID=UPI001FE19498|nr:MULTISPECIES: hypothetical protein [unclassified Mesorhizobium]
MSERRANGFPVAVKRLCFQPWLADLVPSKPKKDGTRSLLRSIAGLDCHRLNHNFCLMEQLQKALVGESSQSARQLEWRPTMMKKILSATVLSIALATSAMAQSTGTGSGTSDPGAGTGTGTGTMAPGTDTTNPADPNVTGSTTTGTDGMADRCKDATQADMNTASGTATSDREDCPE